MRIAVVCPYGLDVPGGVQGQALGMARALAAAHEVLLVGPGRAPGSPTGARGLEVALLGPTVGVRANRSVAPISLSWRAARELRRLLGRFGPDLLVVHEPLVPLCGPVALGHNAPVTVGTFHRSGGFRALWLLRPVVRALLGRLDAGVVVSDEARATIAGLVGAGAGAYATIPNAVDCTRFAVADRPLGDGQRVVFVGRHEPRKGLSVLLEAARLLPDGYTIEVIGTGPETARLRASAADLAGVSFLGRVPDGELARRLTGAGLFVAPSLGGESFGVVLLEAMAAGAPVVCSDLPGYRAAAGDAARYVPPGDPVALAVAIRELAEDATARACLADAGRARASASSFEALAAAYLALAGSQLWR